MNDLTHQQKEDLRKMASIMKRLRKRQTNNLDLDVFMSEYNDGGFRFLSTEQINLESKSRNRKEEFLKSGKTKTEKGTPSKPR